MLCPVDVHKILSNFKNRREGMQVDRPLLQQVHSAKRPAKCRISLGLINSHASVNGPVAVHSSSSTPHTRLYLEAEIGAQLCE